MWWGLKERRNQAVGCVDFFEFETGLIESRFCFCLKVAFIAPHWEHILINKADHQPMRSEDSKHPTRHLLTSNGVRLFFVHDACVVTRISFLASSTTMTMCFSGRTGS